jgi:YHS domain-containing protein
MEDEPEQAEYEGETYYFDSTDCQERFEDSPEKFA